MGLYQLQKKAELESVTYYRIGLSELKRFLIQLSGFHIKVVNEILITSLYQRVAIGTIGIQIETTSILSKQERPFTHLF